MEVYKNHVIEYDQKFRQKNIIPKNHSWRPYRWCSKDIVFSLIVVRHSRFDNCLEVDVCLMADPPQYFPNSGASVAMGFLLSEAYKCGTSMEIVFTENVESRMEDGIKKGRVPAYIYDLAVEMGVELKHVMEGHITPFEARQMYMNLVGFSDQVKARVMQLSVDGIISPERACFLVMGGVWSVPEAEAIILGCKNPESILLSSAEPEDRLLYLRDVISARGAILGGSLDRNFLKKEVVIEGRIMDSEDDETEVEIGFDGQYYAKIYKIFEKSVAPWTRTVEVSLEEGDTAIVMVRSRTSAEIQELFHIDMKSLQMTVAKYQEGDSKTKFFFLVPRDFEEIPEDSRDEIRKKVEDTGAYLMISPESVSMLDREAGRRIETGRMVRHE